MTMPVTDDQVVTLRALLSDDIAALRAWLRAGTDAEASDAERRFLTLSRTGRLDEIGALLAALTVTLGSQELDQVLAEGRDLADSVRSAVRLPSEVATHRSSDLASRPIMLAGWQPRIAGSTNPWSPG
jgi:hypothetical protein